VAMAGGIDVMSTADRPSAWIEWNDLAAADPDIIVVCPCGFRIDDSIRDWHLLESNPVWNSLRAVRDERVFIADGNQYFNRPGPRLVESLEILAGIVQQCAGREHCCRGAAERTPPGRCTRSDAMSDTT